MSSQGVSFRADILGLPNSTASPKDSTLVIIDAQNEYALGKLKVSNVASSRKAIKALLEKYRSEGGTIIHVLHQDDASSPVFTAGTSLADEFDELAPAAGEPVVWKKFPGAFAQTDLQARLGAAKKLVLTGYMAHVCVSTTAREAFQLGYEVVLPRDAIGDRDIPGASGDDVTRMVMLELDDLFATVVESKDIK